MTSGKNLDQIIISQSVHKSRQAQVFGNNPKAFKRQRRQENSLTTKKYSPSSINLIKKKLRDVTRRLERSKNIPAGLRIEDERAQTAYLQELATAEAEKKKQRMIKKYHMVRFFERQKASRLVKKIHKQFLSADSPETIETLKKQMHEAEVDLNYTLYHPLSEIYISLYPNSSSLKSDSGELSTAKLKPPIWTEIEQAMETGTLQKIRNRMPLQPVLYSKESIKKTPSDRTKPLNESESKHQLRQAKYKEVRGKNTTAACQDLILKNHQTIEDEENDDSDEEFFE